MIFEVWYIREGKEYRVTCIGIDRLRGVLNAAHELGLKPQYRKVV